MFANPYKNSKCVAYFYEGQKSAETPSRVIASPSDINLFKVILLFCIV